MLFLLPFTTSDVEKEKVRMTEEKVGRFLMGGESRNEGSDKRSCCSQTRSSNC